MKSIETIVGVDFAGPAKASDQRRKIIALRAQTDGWQQYRVSLDDFNRRLYAACPRVDGSRAGRGTGPSSGEDRGVGLPVFHPQRPAS